MLQTCNYGEFVTFKIFKNDPIREFFGPKVQLFQGIFKKFSWGQSLNIDKINTFYPGHFF